jgi:hypothetical protein
VTTSATATTDTKQMINISFCGDYAGRVWHGYTKCAKRTHTNSCEEYVANNPDKFTDVYFMINSVRLFQRNGGKGSLDNSAAVAAAAPITLSRIHSRRPSTSISRLIPSKSTTIGGHDYYPYDPSQISSLTCTTPFPSFPGTQGPTSTKASHEPASTLNGALTDYPSAFSSTRSHVFTSTPIDSSKDHPSGTHD